MNLAVRNRQLARIFVDAQSLRVTDEDARRLVETARLVERMSTPTVLPLQVTDPALPGAPRLLLASQNLDWQLGLLSQSFDLSRLPIDATGSNIGDFREFALTAASVLWACANFFGRLPHRLVLVQTGMLDDMTDDRKTSIARRLMQLPPSFAERSPFEWDWRCARHGTMRLDGRDEETNVLASVKRVSGVWQTGAGERIPFDRVQVELDVNTAPTNTHGRFREEGVREFFTAALDEHARMAEELTTFAALGDAS